MDKFCLGDYKSAILQKENIKLYYDQKIEKREFSLSYLVLLLNSRLCFFHRKLKSSLFKVVHMFLYVTIKHEKPNGQWFKVNGQCVQQYLGSAEEVKVLEVVYLYEVSVIKVIDSCQVVKLGVAKKVT